jgi:hypothetical protein
LQECDDLFVTVEGVEQKIDPAIAVGALARGDSSRFRDHVLGPARVHLAGPQVDHAVGCAKQPRVAIPLPVLGRERDHRRGNQEGSAGEVPLLALRAGLLVVQREHVIERHPVDRYGSVREPEVAVPRQPRFAGMVVAQCAGVDLGEAPPDPLLGQRL